MSRPIQLPRIARIFIIVFLYAFVLVFLYFRSLPQRYEIELGMVSSVDITTQQDVEDVARTEERAREAASRVTQVMTRSAEISDEVLERLDIFFVEVSTIRVQLRKEARELLAKESTSNNNNDETDSENRSNQVSPVATPTPLPEDEPNALDPVLSESAIAAAAAKLVETIDREQGVIIQDTDARTLLGIETSIFNSLQSQTKNIGQQIMQGQMDTSRLSTEISTRVAALVSSVEFFKQEYELVGRVLRLYLRPNLLFDEAATEAARKAEYERVRANPDIVPAGTRILSVGDTVTQEIFDQLKKLDLIENNSVDWRLLGGLAILTLIVFLLGLVYLGYYERQHRVTENGDRFVLITSLLIPYIIAGYSSAYSPLAVPVYFASILIAAYFGLRTAIVMSFLLILTILPMTFLNLTYLFTALLGSLLACYVSAAYRRRDSQVWMIVFTALGSGISALTIGMIGNANWQQVSYNVVVVTITAALSAIGAIGIMPVFETAVSSVSPMTLISLSQPSQALLKRLFIEAPGTNQHSMMVANLSETAADAIGADGMLCRVGSYYHDIGKLEHPEMFTENQDGFNIHDTLEPEDSVRYIIGHVSAGLKTARRYRLPLPIQKIIEEHHGNSLQASFYYAAKKKAEENGLEPPNPDDFRYPWNPPTSRESGIVMLADSMEAAMKSTRTNNIEDTEILARKIAKSKIEQDQLINSGLSFKDVELIIQSFVQLYQGQFHERVRYPDASTSSNSEPAAYIQERSHTDDTVKARRSPRVDLDTEPSRD